MFWRHSVGLGLAFLALGCAPASPPAGPPIVLITVDTLRADRLGCYGYFRDTSPAIDAFAAEGVRFQRAIAPMSVTLPTHLSLMTSVDPIEHGVKSNFRVFEEPSRERSEIQTFAQMLSRLGYTTAAFVSAAPVKDITGMDAGFATFDQPKSFERTADETTERALDWLRGHVDHSFFLWIHYYDPHRPYSPPEPYDSMFETNDRLLSYLQKQRFTDPTNYLIQEFQNMYDGEVRFTDAQVGRLFDAFRAHGIWDRAAVVLTADHGEGLGQHDWIDHVLLYREQLHVPLIVKFPSGASLNGTSREELVGIVDVLPTLVAQLGLELEPEDRRQFRGEDAFAAGTARRAVVSERVANSREWDAEQARYTVSSADWKLFRLGDGKERLFDLRSDPLETTDVLAENPESATDLRRELDAALAHAQARAPLLRVQELHDPALAREADERLDLGGRRQMRRELFEQLRAIGYFE